MTIELVYYNLEIVCIARSMVFFKIFDVLVVEVYSVEK